MAGTTARRRYNKTPQRRKIPGVGAQTQRGHRTPINIVSAEGVAEVVTVVFDQPVVLHGLPGWTGANDAAVVSAEMTDAVTCVMTFATTPTTPLTIPFEDPGIRNSVGGYVRPASQVLG
jgi:hypothetical protein